MLFTVIARVSFTSLRIRCSIKIKAYDVRYHWIHDVLESKQLYLEKIHTSENG